MLPTTPAAIHNDEVISDGSMRRVLAMRYARIGFGAMLIVGFALMCFSACQTQRYDSANRRAHVAAWAQVNRELPYDGSNHDERQARVAEIVKLRPLTFSKTVAIVWASAIGVWAMVNVVTRCRRRSPYPLAADAWRKASLVLPMVGVALALPATLQVLFVVSHGDAHAASWFLTTTLMVLHAYIAVALLAGLRAARVADDEPALSPTKIFFVVAGIGALPWIVSFFYVALTGLPFLWILGWPERALAREQALLNRDASREQTRRVAPAR